MNIPDKAINAAAKYLAYLMDGDPYPADAILFGAKVDPDDEDHARELVQYIAPLIAAQALRDADKSIVLEQFSPTEHGSLIVVKEELRYRADELDPQ